MQKGKRVLAWLLALITALSTAGCALPDADPTERQTRPAIPSGIPESTVPKTTTTAATEPVSLPATAPPGTEPASLPATAPPETEPASLPATAPPETEPVSHPPTEPPVTTGSSTAATQAAEQTQQGGIPNRVTVEASGTLVKSNAKAVIDYSNTKDGYVMVCYTAQTEKKLKARVQGPSNTYTYDLIPEKWSAFPLSDENGTYKVTVYQNVEGSKYAAVLSLTAEVWMTDEFAPFLRSNQYVDFDAAPMAVAKAAQLTAGISDPLEKVEKVYDFVVGSLAYDQELASTVRSGYLPELDKILEKQKGICFDYAALMTGMLRSQGIPTKLVVGYAGTVYHAWISVWSETDGWVDGVIWFDGASWQRMDPTFASSGGSSADILDYIGNGSNYTPKYFY